MKTVETVHYFSKLLLTHDLSRGLAKLSCDSFNRFSGLFAFWSRLTNIKRQITNYKSQKKQNLFAYCNLFVICYLLFVLLKTYHAKLIALASLINIWFCYLIFTFYQKSWLKKSAYCFRQ
ncbi:MAG: hypothetical protein ABIG69_13335 [Bacteroidota bacterium]